MNKIRISEVYSGSIAEEAGIEAGDILLTVNGQTVIDVFDYRFLTQDEELVLEVMKPDGNILRVDIEKDEFEDIGLEFENPLIDEEKSCRNKCIFCFIDQLPKGMRESLYFKDDDARLSFLFGNYITMTNMGKSDIDRIIRYHMSPVNVSVHTTNPELRVKMLNNRFAGDILEKMKILADGGITLNVQIVLCRNINDGLELDRTLNDLSTLMPQLNSISVVPVGLTKFREGLPVLKPFDRDSAIEVIAQVKRWQELFLEETGGRRVFLADEWYLMTDTPFPPFEHYEDFPQVENVVGMAVLFTEEFNNALSGEEKRPVEKTVSIATGILGSKIITGIAKRAEEHFPGLKVLVYPIENNFFGKSITVSGLLTGVDIKTQLTGKYLGDVLLLPSNMFRAGTDIFLDDMTLGELASFLHTDIRKVSTDGGELLSQLIS